MCCMMSTTYISLKGGHYEKKDFSYRENSSDRA